MSVEKNAITQKIFSLPVLLIQIEDWKKKGEKIVFTNGCFDLIHPGHLSYLLEAANLGDKLIIGVNTDRSVRKIKGEERPINNQQSRLQLLAALFFVDAVVLFDEPTPADLIKAIKPHILVKGGDYKIEDIVGAKETIERGGAVKVLNFLPGYSSTHIIEKIKQL
ncbi:D-glycero-beta-D-manno-heptose 1-phosphate adenylyltransferase [Pedobacter cryotolerans]|uniref:D-glycero-beta-D-manno-heptose 1-phosphate adenylyltransferase n=1 Tax=Pedobacter cryotolerans TaxID=2571270 RepID=A0A4U1C6Z9_9SPHI|nr:D-glycero-beta-D-manno-heptose 1-phosphate adenylyltransferase [Pedobacter cryotolerans]TKC01204.1 D-glycero-beta-D-manno-heptose 1-phosphate adenylyltransferase [Pedobacter cryotolerans]